MGTLKYTVGSALASASLLLAPAAPAAAFGDNNSVNDSNNNNGNSTETVTVTETKTITIGDCVVMMDDIKAWLNQSNDQGNVNSNVDVDLGGGGLPYVNEFNGPRGGDDEGNTTNQSNSNNQSQSNSGSITITVAPDCSVTNVTQAAAEDEGEVLGDQAEAAKGGVGAGFGAASSITATVGALTSVLGAGFGIRRFGN